MLMYHILINIKVMLHLVMVTKLSALMINLVNQCKNIAVELQIKIQKFSQKIKKKKLFKKITHNDRRNERVAKKEFQAVAKCHICNKLYDKKMSR